MHYHDEYAVLALHEAISVSLIQEALVTVNTIIHIFDDSIPDIANAESLKESHKTCLVRVLIIRTVAARKLTV